MARRLGLLIILCALVLGAALLWQLYQTRRALESGDLEREYRQATGQVDLPETLADRVFETLGLEWAGIEASQEPWGYEDEDGNYLEEPLTREEARKTLRPSRKLQKFFLERMAAGLETPGTDTLLGREPDLGQHRGITSRLAGNMLSMLVLGKPDQALLILETCHVHARIMARGFQGRPQLIASLIAVAQQRTLDRAVAHGLDLGLWPEESLPALAAVLQEALEKTMDLDRAMHSEFDTLADLVDLVDRRLGPAASLARLYWGDGQAQVARIRAAWEAGKPWPKELINGRCHVMVRVAPDWTPHVQDHAEVLAERRQVLARVLARVQGGGGNQTAASQ